MSINISFPYELFRRELFLAKVLSILFTVMGYFVTQICKNQGILLLVNLLKLVKIMNSVRPRTRA